MRLEHTFEEPRLEVQRMQLIETADGLLLKRGRVVVEIQGADAKEAVQLLLARAASGEATRQSLCELFPAPDRAAIDELLQALERRGILTPRPAGEPAAGGPEGPLDIFYWHFGKRADQVAGQLNRRAIAIVGVNCVSRQLATALMASGMTTVQIVDYPLLCNLRLVGDDGAVLPNEWPSSLRPPVSYRAWMAGGGAPEEACVVATSDFGGQQLLREWNRYCVETGRHFLPVVLQDLVGQIGPLVIPGETPCLECLRARQNAQMDDPDTQRTPEYVAFEGQGVNGFHPSMASILGDLAAVELLKFYGQLVRSQLAGHLIEVNLLAPQLTVRRVLRAPRCAVCSPSQTRSPVSQDKGVSVPGHPVSV
jgi:bacteriocin biosynthesis cyclodehydratase domain-containing protein